MTKSYNYLQKMLLLIFLFSAMGGVKFAWGKTATFSYKDYIGQGTLQSGSPVSATVDGITISYPNGYGNDSYTQFYFVGDTTTITSERKITISRIEIIAFKTEFNGGNWSAPTGKISANDKKITWTGSATDGLKLKKSKQLQWTSIVVTYEQTEKYTVKFDAGENGTCETTVIEEKEIDAGITLPTCLPKDGFTFIGWATTPDTEVADAGKAGETYFPTKNITLYAVYAQTCTITWSVNGVTTTEEAANGSAITFATPKENIPDGYEFTGWSATEIPTQQTAPEYVTEATANGDATYYAVFAKEENGSGDASWAKIELSEIQPTDVIVIVGNSSYAISNNNGLQSSPTAIPVIIKGNKITSTISDDIKWNISGDATNGYKFAKNGTKVYLFCNTSQSALYDDKIRVGSNSRDTWIQNDNGYWMTKDNFKTRYLSLYISDDGSNTKEWRGYTTIDYNPQLLSFYKVIEKSYSDYCTSVSTEPITFTEAPLKLAAQNKNGFWATFSSDQTTFFTDDVVLYTAVVNDGALTMKSDVFTGGNTTIEGNTIKGHYVPANTGVLIKSADNSLTYYTVKGKNIEPLTDNMLYPGTTEMTGDNWFYKLAYNDFTAKTGLGFYWGADDGAPFKSKEGLAYLAVPKTTYAKTSFVFDNETSGIKNIESMTEATDNGEVYNLAGMRVNANYKGIVIVKGKKIIQK